jgi:transketolase
MKFQWPNESLTHPKTRLALRQVILEQITAAKSGHPGGSLSLVEILASIYGGYFYHDVKNPKMSARDRLILSKGHGVPALYSVLSYLGYIPPSDLKHLRSMGHYLQGHPDRNRYDLMEASTGSLGQGLSVALGAAMGLRLSFLSKSISRLPRVYCVLGDGETQEGQVWEALMAAPKFKAGNLIAILDYNKGQIDGPVSEIMNLEPLVDKLKAFNWSVQVVDGHNIDELDKALARIEVEPQGLPHFIVAHTLKGKGISFMEHPTDWHGAAPKPEQLKAAIDELLSGQRPFGEILG